MRPQHVRMARDPTVIWCLFFYRTLADSRTNFILPEAIEFLNYITATIVWVYLYLILRNCFRKPRKEVQLMCVSARLQRLLSRETARISAQTLYRQKQALTLPIFAADSMIATVHLCWRADPEAAVVVAGDLPGPRANNVWCTWGDD